MKYIRRIDIQAALETHQSLPLRRHWTQWLCQIQDQESFYRVSFVSPEQCAQIYGEAVDTPEE